MEILKTRRLALRPVESSDSLILDSWHNSGDYLELVSSREVKNRHTHCMVVHRSTGKPIGEAYTFSYNKSDGWMFLNVFICEEYRKFGYGAEACIMIICYTFEHIPLYKMYCDAFATNAQSIAMMEGAGLHREGLLKGHRFYSGRRYDVVRFAVHQDNLPRLNGLLGRFKRKT